MKIGEKIDFYLFGIPEKGVIYDIKEWNIEEGTVIGVEHGWGKNKRCKYLVRIFKTLPKKIKEIPPWYIIGKDPQNRKKSERKKLK